MVMYANEFKTKEKQKLTELKKNDRKRYITRALAMHMTHK